MLKRKVSVMEPLVYEPTVEEIQIEREYWEQMDRIAEYETFFVAQAEDQERDYSDDHDCDESHETYDEYVAMNRQYEIAIRGY